MIEELGKLREDAGTTAIRLGELEQLAQAITQVSTLDARSLLDTLSDDERRLLQLAHTKRGNRISLAFEDRKIGFTLPMFPVHVSDTKLRRISFQVSSPTRKTASITSVQMLNEDSENMGNDTETLTALTRLLRSPGALDGDGWFGLYAAEYFSRNCEATVRVARWSEDLNPSHFELVRIDNLSSLTELGMEAIVRIQEKIVAQN